jgi:GT2 family glycosyltransferase
MMNDLVSIICPTYNKLDFLKQMMESVEGNTQWPFELIIVDNASTDGTQDYVLNSNLKMNGQYIRNEENKGFAIANNIGAKVAKGNFLCFLNNDTIVTNNWLTAMMNVFSEEKAVGVVGARLIHPGAGTIQHAGIVQYKSGIPDHIYFKKPMNYPSAMIRKQYFAVTGACMLTPKALFEELEGFDERYWCGWEDMDYCQKVNLKGHKIYYEPKALVYHYESRTEGRYSKEGSNFTLYMSKWILGKK